MTKRVTQLQTHINAVWKKEFFWNPCNHSQRLHEWIEEFRRLLSDPSCGGEKYLTPFRCSSGVHPGKQKTVEFNIEFIGLPSEIDLLEIKINKKGYVRLSFQEVYAHQDQLVEDAGHNKLLIQPHQKTLKERLYREYYRLSDFIKGEEIDKIISTLLRGNS